MKCIFVSYGDRNYSDSLQRIGKEAEALHLFQEIKLYTYEMLPDLYKSYAHTYKRGGGYWLWKPYILHNALQEAEIGDLLVYADAGCTLMPHKDWNRYFNLLRGHDHREGLFFLGKGKNRRWCKRAVFNEIDLNRIAWGYANQLQATFFILQKCKENRIINAFYDLSLTRPDLFTDISVGQRQGELAVFREHRHDQAVLSALLHSFSDQSCYHLLCGNIERRMPGGQAVLASRISQNGARGVLKSSPQKGLLSSWVDRLLVNPLELGLSRFLYRLDL